MIVWEIILTVVILVMVGCFIHGYMVGTPLERWDIVPTVVILLIIGYFIWRRDK